LVAAIFLGEKLYATLSTHTKLRSQLSITDHHQNQIQHQQHYLRKLSISSPELSISSTTSGNSASKVRVRALYSYNNL
jgi:hypothetical protein